MENINTLVVDAPRIKESNGSYERSNLSSQEKALLGKYMPTDSNNYGCDSCNSCGSGNCNSCCETGDD